MLGSTIYEPYNNDDDDDIDDDDIHDNNINDGEEDHFNMILERHNIIKYASTWPLTRQTCRGISITISTSVSIISISIVSNIIIIIRK